VDDTEQRFTDMLNDLREMSVSATGSSDPMLERLIDPATRRSHGTPNYLVSTASGTLSDRIFCSENGDTEPVEGYSAFNSRYRVLLAEARDLASSLQRPAVRDRAAN
jgi:hypothetical protein